MILFVMTLAFVWAAAAFAMHELVQLINQDGSGAQWRPITNLQRLLIVLGPLSILGGALYMVWNWLLYCGAEDLFFKWAQHGESPS